MTEKTVSVKDFGAVGDGIHDDRAAFQTALDSGAEVITVPLGYYRISETLYIPSNTTLSLDKCARLVLKGDRKRRRGDFLLSNSDPKCGNENITVIGGVFDGNNTDPNNSKPDIFEKDGYSGAVLNFVGVRGLSLRDVTVANSTTYYVRMSRVENFDIENIDLVSDFFGKNQDGLHFGGGVRHGRVRNVRALSNGQTNDDMIAFNADDCVERVENFDLSRDDIEDITVENVFAVNCYTIIRLLSVNVAIRNVKIKGVYAGYRNYAINGDGARYCKTPLFVEDERPDGVGCIENVEIEDFICYPITENPKNLPYGQIDPTYAVRLECHADNLTFKNFKKLRVDSDEGTYAFLGANTPGMCVLADGKEYLSETKDNRILIEEFENLKVTKK